MYFTFVMLLCLLSCVNSIGERFFASRTFLPMRCHPVRKSAWGGAVRVAASLCH